MVTTCGATLAWSATTVTVAGGVDARLGGRRGWIFSGSVAGAVVGAVVGDWATVDAGGPTVCARPVMVKDITAVAAIKNINSRWKFVFIILLDITTTNFGCSD
jgi:hypothetical protein